MSFENIFGNRLSRCGKRTKRSLASVKLARNGWPKIEEAAFLKCEFALKHQATLAHYDVNQRLGVYTDGSDLLRPGIVTKVSSPDLSQSHVQQRHSSLAFNSGHFPGPQLGWFTLDNEAFEIITTTERLHWLLATPDEFNFFFRIT